MAHQRRGRASRRRENVSFSRLRNRMRNQRHQLMNCFSSKPTPPVVGHGTLSNLIITKFQRSLAVFACLAFSGLITPGSVGAAVALKCVGSEWDAYGNYLSVFMLTNDTDRAISYFGYAPSQPVYTTQIRNEIQWREEATGWCGVGFGAQNLFPKQSVTFRVSPPQDGQAWRVGIEIEVVDSRNAQTRIRTVWSPPARRQSLRKKISQDADATRLVQTAVSWNPDHAQPYTFSLINTSTDSLFYGGYQEPTVPPIFLNQVRYLGKWREDGVADWSGSDIGFKELRAGDSIRFSIPAQSQDSTWRIGIRLFRSDAPHAQDDAYEPVWWPELPRDGTAPGTDAEKENRTFRSQPDSKPSETGARR